MQSEELSIPSVDQVLTVAFGLYLNHEPLQKVYKEQTSQRLGVCSSVKKIKVKKKQKKTMSILLLLQLIKLIINLMNK